MQHIIYIGKNKQTIAHFIQLLKGELKIAESCYEATKLLSKCDNPRLTIILYEKETLKKDLSDITYLHNKFCLTYIVLITESVSKEESPLYLKSGICDTLHPNETKENFDQTINFIVKRQRHFNAVLRNHNAIKQFHLPVWKRIFDIIFASLALICLFPLLLLVAIAIRLESKGPIVYKSKRVGSNYKIFDFLKFRSMYTNADKRLKEFNNLNQYISDEEDSGATDISANNNEEKVVKEEMLLVSDDYVIPEKEYIAKKSIEKKNAFVKLENDPRITKVGQFIRKFSIDELPQLINIIKGDMSVVGNRPLPLYEAELLTSDEYIDRFMAPAGLTGLWQVEKRGEAGKLSSEERKMLDIKYANDYSFALDMKIILKTVTAFVQKENV
ncbi:sugar transferase [Bacteroides sedimenti]|uniref:Glycosyl transferase n=1 Tax=Bacteroides sedimenti TaxID=2136147 RepID=A0ABM8I9S1_9BACE